jgi:hypothetical protein
LFTRLALENCMIKCFNHIEQKKGKKDETTRRNLDKKILKYPLESDRVSWARVFEQFCYCDNA